MRRLAQFPLAAFVAAALAGPAAWAADAHGEGAFADRVVALAEPAPAPETEIDLGGGGRTSIGAHLGDVVIVTLWATWCHVCDHEMPELAAVARRFEGRGLTVMPVSVDEPPAEAVVAKEIAENGLAPLPVMLDRNFALAGRVGLRGTPTTLIVDKFGRIVAGFEGRGPWTDPATIDYLEALIAAEDEAASASLLAGR